jgi:hypothetical protein
VSAVNKGGAGVTRVVVEAGICGFTTTVEATKTGKRRVSVVVESDCEGVAEMNGQLQDMDWLEALGPPGKSVVWNCACAHIKHPSCPVPMGILKAIEVELDLALPKDVVIRFEHVGGE